MSDTEQRDKTTTIDGSVYANEVLWCVHHGRVGVTDPERLWGDGNPLWCGADGSATCPGPHRRLMLGEFIGGAA